MWSSMCIKTQEYLAIVGAPHKCLTDKMNVVYASLATIDGLIAIFAATQLLRHYLHNKHAGWTRQKVFHSLIGASNFGYSLYFVVTPVAACKGWACFSNTCGFILIAAPQILFLATFLLLLSFWVDLCNQATDNDEEEEDDEDGENEYEQLPSSQLHQVPGASNRHRARCLSMQRWRVRGRQRFVIVVVFGIFLLTIAFALLIWYGMYDNPVDSVKMAQVYANFFAIVILLSGGGLAGYGGDVSPLRQICQRPLFGMFPEVGLLLYTKMCRVKSGKASADIKKVAVLAVASVVCFSLRAFLVLMSDIPVLNIWHMKNARSNLCPTLTFLYYLIGESIPSIVVLWVMRELPPKLRDNSLNGCVTSQDVLIEEALVPNPGLLPQWVVSAAGRPYLVLPACCNSDISPT